MRHSLPCRLCKLSWMSDLTLGKHVSDFGSQPLILVETVEWLDLPMLIAHRKRFCNFTVAVLYAASQHARKF
nr:hypothetical protein CFP56_24487 [Quercus suber]